MEIVSEGLISIGDLSERSPAVFGPGDVGYVSVVLCEMAPLLVEDVPVLHAVAPLLEHLYQKDLRALRLYFTETVLLLSGTLLSGFEFP